MFVSSFAYLSLVLCAATMGSSSVVEADGAAHPAVSPPAAATAPADAEEARRLAEWKAKYVRPCVKSGDRLTC
jgi:hypothetical protein